MEFKLIEPTIEYKEKYLEFLVECGSEDDLVPYAAGLRGRTYEQFLSDLPLREKKETAPKGLVPDNLYILVDENKNIYGALNFRHELNDYLFNFGGHFGYGIRPTKRGNGYAKIMVKLALDKAREKGLKRILITCDKSNIASAKTITGCGGVLENEVLCDGEVVQRYWIDL